MSTFVQSPSRRVNVALTLLAGSLLLAVASLYTVSAAGLTRSAAKVDVTAQWQAPTSATDIRVQLDIADGWHVNSHPASLDFLVPTTIKARAGGKTLPLKIDWPAGRDSNITLGGTTIEVYSDNAVIPVRLASASARQALGDQQPTLRVRVQACSNSGLCLPPSTISLQPISP